MKVTLKKLGLLLLFTPGLNLSTRSPPTTDTVAPPTSGAKPGVPTTANALAGRVKVTLSTSVAVFNDNRKVKACTPPCVIPHGDNWPKAPGVAVDVAVGVPVDVGVAVPVKVTVDVPVSVPVGVAVELLVGVAVSVGVAVDVPVSVPVGVAVELLVGVAVQVGKIGRAHV